jgi:tRNA modification GTPase
VLRLSGPRSADIAEAVAGVRPRPRHAHYAAFRDAAGAVIDRGLLLYFPAPASYTGEDVLELHGHGGDILPRLLLERLVELGARHAAPGEFTQRAFLNDKLDLVQAEAVADAIDSGSERAARSAMRSLEGMFSGQVNAMEQALIELRVQVEGGLDFPEEELALLQESGLQDRLDECLQDLQRLLASAARGRALRRGLHIVILGRPNVGKSSLLNRLARSERAIVTEVPGTTRDLIEDQIVLDGVTVNMVDTAGIRASGDAIEREGMERAFNAAAAADAVLLIQDSRDPDEPDLAPAQMQRLAAVPEFIIIRNKIDLSGEAPALRQDAAGRSVISLSARTGAGLDRLVSRLQELGGAAAGEDAVLARDRHLAALERAREALQQGRQRLQERAQPELLAEDLRQAQSALAELTGAVAADDLLGEIFARFCIGK